MGDLNQPRLDALKLFLSDYPPHLQTMLDGAVASFSDKSNPVRFTNTANIFREMLRELFAAVAPDSNIVRCSWFKPDDQSIKKGGNGVTRRHRIQFAIYSFLEPKHFPTDFVTGIDSLTDDILEDVGKLNALTHVTASVLATPEQDAIAAFDATVVRFLQLFVAVNSAQEHLLEDLQNEIQQTLSDIFTSDFFDELDILSTHTRPQEAEDVEVEIKEIGEDWIRFKGTGSVLCNLQYGSDGDCARGDGLEMSDSYPFKFSGRAETANPSNVTVNRGNISVDTSSFYEDAEPDPET